MAVYNEADFVMQGREVQDPEIAKDELELYYDVKGKKNGDIHKNKLLDMSGQGKDGELSGFDYDGELSGYVWGGGLIFDGIEDTLKMPELNGIDANNFTYQLNNNVISYGEGGTVKWVKDGKVMERKGINLVRNGVENWNTGRANLQDSNGVIKVTKPKDVTHLDFWYQSHKHIEGHQYFISMQTRAEGDNAGKIIRGNDKNQVPIKEQVLTNEWAPFYYINPNPFVGRTIYPGFSTALEFYIKEVQLIDLTATFGAGNEPTLEEIQADPDKWQWTPNPMDLLEAKELGGNILGDMEEIVDATPRDRQSGKEVFTEHADDSHVQVEVDGQSYQHAGSGKNLSTVFRTNAYRTSTYVIIESDNLVALKSLNSNPPTSMLNPKNSAFVRANSGQYTISFEVSDSSVPIRTTILVKDIDGAIITSGVTGHGVYNIAYGGFYLDSLDTTRTFTLPQNTHSVAVGLQIPHVGVEAARENKVFNLQLEEGSAATEYEPPAPTPDYPVEIHSLNDFDVVSSVGKRNLLVGKENGNYRLNNNNGNINPSIYKSYEDYDSVTLIGGHELSTYSSEVFTLEKGKEYTFSMYVYSPVKSDLRARNRIVDWTTVPANTWTRLSRTLIGTGKEQRIGALYSRSDEVLNQEIFYNRIKLEEGGSTTPYLPAPEDITPDTDHPLIDKINLSLSEPLRSVGDVHDRLFRDSDGLWKVERNVGEIIVDGTESGWRDRTDDTGGLNNVNWYQLDISANNYVSGSGVNTHFSVITAAYQDYEHVRVHGNNDLIWYGIFPPKSMHTNLDEFKLWLKSESDRGNPLTTLYKLSTPTIETLDQELQDQLNTLKSFKDSNYVYTVQNTDSPHKEQLKPTLHTTFNSKDYLKETRTITNLLIWARELTDEELIHHNQLFLNRFNLPSDRVIGEPIEQTLNLLHGGVVGHSLEQNYTINI